MMIWKDSWLFGTALEVRNDKYAYDIAPSAIYPRMQVLPILKRNGFKRSFHGLTPFELFHAILTNQQAETLLKVEQTALLHYFVRRSHRCIGHYWPSIRICIRNGYTIKDGSLWCDLIESLRILGKDTHNPKYICPSDLQLSHDHWQSEVRKQREKEQLERQRQKALEDEARFHALKSKFFGIHFTDGTIQVRVLESVREYLEEGVSMHHCVFDNAYYLKENSLILSATLRASE